MPDDASTPAERDRSALKIPIWLERTAGWSWRLLVLGAAVFALLWLALLIRLALVPFLVALIVAATLRGPARRLEGWGAPRAIAAAIPMVIVGGLCSVCGWFIYNRTRSTLTEEDALSEAEIRARIDDWLAGDPFNLTQRQIDDAEESVRSWLASGVDTLGAQEATIALQVVSGAVLAVVLTFYLIKDGSQMWQSVASRVSPLRVTAVERSGRAVADTLSAYLRSVVITGVIDALLIGIGLWLLGVPLVIPLMILTALAGLFPLVGAVVAGFSAALVALITVDPATAIWVIVLTIVVQQVEGNILQPLIMARQVSIHPVVVLVSLTAGGAVAGLVGAFLAVPLVAATMTAITTFSADMEPDELAPVADLDA